MSPQREPSGELKSFISIRHISHSYFCYIDPIGVEWGLGIGCTIAILMMIISCTCFIIEVYEYCTYVPPPRVKPPPVGKSAKPSLSPHTASEFVKNVLISNNI